MLTLPSNTLDTTKIPTRASKYLVLGDSQCGKTSILNYFCRNAEFNPKATQTIGCEIHVKEILNGESQEYVEFWEISGRVAHQDLGKVYLKALENDISSLKGIIFCFDVTNIKSLEHIRKYLEDLVLGLLSHKSEVYGEHYEDMTIPLLIIGNKLDLLENGMTSAKINTINQHLSCIFDGQSEVRCLLLSEKFPTMQFHGLESFLKDTLAENQANLFLYGPKQELYSPDKFSNYTKRKIESLTKDFKRAQNFISLKMFHYYTLILALAWVPKKQTGFLGIVSRSFD